jgi:hypothetical protein
MKILIILGVLISGLGLLGLIKCVHMGFQIKKMERLGTTDPDQLKKLLGKLSAMNMLSLSSSLFGLIILVLAIILD